MDQPTKLSENFLKSLCSGYRPRYTAPTWLGPACKPTGDQLPMFILDPSKLPLKVKVKAQQNNLMLSRPVCGLFFLQAL